MNFQLSISVVVTLLAVSFHSEAQTSLEGFSTGRYEVRKSASSSKRRPASENETAPVVTDSDGMQVRALKESEIAAEEKAKKEAELAKIEAAKKETEKERS